MEDESSDSSLSVATITTEFALSEIKISTGAKDCGGSQVDSSGANLVMPVLQFVK